MLPTTWQLSLSLGGKEGSTETEPEPEQVRGGAGKKPSLVARAGCAEHWHKYSFEAPKVASLRRAHQIYT